MATRSPARLQGVDGPGEEIVVDGESGVVLVLGVEDPDIAEGEVGDDQVHAVVADLPGLLEAFDKDLRFRVELGEDKPAQSGPSPRPGSGSFRRCSWGMSPRICPTPPAGSRIGPALEPQAVDDRPEAVFDDFAGGIEGVQDGGFGFVPFLLGEEAAELRMELLADPLEPGLVFLLVLFGE